ncbi:MAG: acyltransferase [Thermodesulfovibrio sp.]|nr:acyltransferase [Thermodesulfovibrio sp.]
MDHYTAGRDNNFNLIRFVAASTVLFSHSFPLAIGPLAVEPQLQALGTSFGGIAVDIFFIVSGFLVTASLLNRRSMPAFIWARAVRIYPALVSSVLLTVLLIGLFITTVSPYSYFFSMETLSFIGKNSSIMFGSFDHLPGAFKATPFKNAVNGSLWTLPWEIRMYGILALLGALAYSWKILKEEGLKYLVVAIAVCSVAAFIWNHFSPFASNRKLVLALRLLPMFFMGASLCVLRTRIFLSHRLTALVVSVLVVSSVSHKVFFVVYTLCIAYLVVYAAYVPAGLIRRFNNAGDYSYGIYIYAYPVQQSVATLVPGISVAAMFCYSFVVTFMFAFFSWHVIEKRMLALKKGELGGPFGRLFNQIGIFKSIKGSY